MTQLLTETIRVAAVSHVPPPLTHNAQGRNHCLLETGGQNYHTAAFCGVTAKCGCRINAHDTIEVLITIFVYKFAHIWIF